MAHQFIKDLKEGTAVRQYFLLRRVEKRLDKTGKPYLAVILGDQSGTMEARVWSDMVPNCPGPYAAGDEVGLRGQVSSYKGELQVNIQTMVTVADLKARGKELKDYDPELLYLTTPYDRQVLWRELWELACHLKSPLKELVLGLMERYRADLLVCPAARLYHHPYLGGLLEHTWSVARSARAYLTVYPGLNPDLVLAGAILHDLGKVKELAGPQAPEFTTSGQLLGHIVLGWEMVREQARETDFADATLLLQLEHIILSHHGTLEFGSPVQPKTREALLVYTLDDLDAKMKMMDTHLESDAGEGDFTSYHRVLQRGLYKGGHRPAPPEAPGEPEK